MCMLESLMKQLQVLHYDILMILLGLLPLLEKIILFHFILPIVVKQLLVAPLILFPIKAALMIRITLSRNYTITFTPSVATNKVELTFNAFDLETGNEDGMTIYDGPTTASPMISSGLPAGTNCSQLPCRFFLRHYESRNHYLNRCEWCDYRSI